MSASLVGSEMCIRDSPRPASAGKSRPRRVSQRTPPGAPAECRRRGPRPVSYTHLTLPTICSV
eukprot:5189573-Alexandrium_andersonii.AAC.1